jgi:catechol 2,3-dioxygenase-like lactoylglutathione lyase family enzyme
MKALFEVVILPVPDPDRSLLFYRDQVGFDLDVDYAPTPAFRVVQLTPEGASSSIQFGVGLTDAAAGSVRGLYLVVPDIAVCRLELIDRGVDVGEIRHKDTEGGQWVEADCYLDMIQDGPTTPASPTSVIPTATAGYSKSAATADPIIGR